MGYYCEELLRAMLAGNHEDQFFVFSHMPLTVNFPSSNGNLKFTNSAHFPVRAFYLHLLLPKILDTVRPDICHYTNFLAPISEDRPYVVTIHDMVRAQHTLLGYLGVRQLAMVAGGSIGGQQALQWAISYPGMVRKTVVIAATAAISAQAIAFNGKSQAGGNGTDATGGNRHSEFVKYVKYIVALSCVSETPAK